MFEGFVWRRGPDFNRAPNEVRLIIEIVEKNNKQLGNIGKMIDLLREKGLSVNYILPEEITIQFRLSDFGTGEKLKINQVWPLRGPLVDGREGTVAWLRRCEYVPSSSLGIL